MKKKLLSLCLVLALALTAIGGTLAYFTDTDTKDNVFAVGGVKIALIEQQRNDDSTGLEAFEDGKILMPIVGSAQGEKEEVGGIELPTAENYVDKIITVANTGTSEAYMKVYIAIPSALDDVSDASKNILHFNTTGASSEAGEWQDTKLVKAGFEINEIAYNVYSRTYSSVVDAGESTATPAFIGFYLDKRVDMNDDGGYTFDGTDIKFDLKSGVTIPVYAVGVQAAGFESADDAFVEAFGADFNPWAK